MKIFDPERWILRLCAFAIALVFIWLMPSTQIIAPWFPGKTDWLWLFPAALFGLSLLAWLMYRLKLPDWIERGIFEDRRMNRQPLPLNDYEKKIRWLRPMLRLTSQVFMLAGVCALALCLMRSGWMQTWLVNLP